MNKEELSKMSGENQGGDYKFDVPMLALEGEDGYFRLTQNKQETKLGDEVKGVMLKFRCQYGAYLNEGERILFTSEKDNAQKRFDLIEITSGKNGKKFTQTIDKGTGKELKERNPDLKFKQMVYFLLDDDQVVKLQIKGSSLSNLYRTKEQAEAEGEDVGYFNQFGESEHKFEFETIMQANQYSKKIGNKIKTFYRIKFVKGGKLDDARMEVVGAKIKYVFDRLQAIEELKTSRGKEQEQPPVDDYEAETAPAPEEYEHQ
jgi:hypothetical protein